MPLPRIEPPDPPDVPYSVYLMKEDTKGFWVGGSTEEDAAIQIACAVYVAQQGASFSNTLAVAVFDTDGDVITYIGRHSE